VFYSEQKGMKFYALHLQSKELKEGHNPGALGLDGWKSLSKKDLVEMYRDGKLKYAQVHPVHDKLKRADHLKALEHGKVTESELEAAGVFVHEKKASTKPSKPKVDPSGGRVVTVSLGHTTRVGDMKTQNPEVAKVLVEWQKRQSEKEASEARGKKGFVVELNKEEVAAMIKRHQNKGKCTIR
jgi:hypothetical protein